MFFFDILLYFLNINAIMFSVINDRGESKCTKESCGCYFLAGYENFSNKVDKRLAKLNFMVYDQYIRYNNGGNTK